MKPVADQTLYEILEVPFDAPESEIVKAWERAEALYGPGSLTTYTLVSPEEAAVMGAKLEEALHVLLDPAERTRYDAQIRAGPAANGAHREANGIAWAAAAAAPMPPIVPPLVLLPPPDAGGAEDAEPLDEVARPPAPDAPEEGGAAQRPEPPPILLTQVVSEPDPIPLSTPAPISPPFAALLESPAALAVSPLAVAVPPLEAARAQAPLAEDETEFVLPEGAAFTGDALRRAREARGLGIQEVCERTKVSRYHLENIEADRRDKLPAPVYLRGILMALARELRLDGQKVARSYFEAAASQAEGKAR